MPASNAAGQRAPPIAAALKWLGPTPASRQLTGQLDEPSCSTGTSAASANSSPHKAGWGSPSRP
eukprot:8272263-Lingulodinium_polyedra.AAC.1